MHEVAAPLATWESFYVIVGTSAAALTGLMFVVVVIIADGPRGVASHGNTIAAFATPTVVHFCASLLISAIVSAPWPALIDATWAIGITGFVGLGYAVIVWRRASRQTIYKPVFEDWFSHIILPLAAYLALLVAAFMLESRTTLALFIIGGAAILLILIGIHNAWDTITYLAVERRKTNTGESTES